MSDNQHPPDPGQSTPAGGILHRTYDPDTVRSVNVAFHREQASHYDDTHDVHPVAERLFRTYVSEEDRVLDLGTGTGFVRDCINATDIVGIDISRAMLRAGRPTDARLAMGAAAALPVADASVDVVTARSVLHHLPDLERAAAECRRVLRPGGLVVAAGEPVPSPFRERLLHHARSWLGAKTGRSQTGWKARLAGRYDTHVAALTDAVNVHTASGVSPQPFDRRLDVVERVTFSDDGKDQRAYVWRHSARDAQSDT